ncbi:unnamed protein product [Adineta ricciae]|uniref:Squalene synthase n=1 Tax=Adineta ricciae TaxID=249248 RepID=A0A816GBU4_ADIRI|nr:unnamed protein product [Adineta ricciae]
MGTLINVIFYYLYRYIPAILSDLSKSLLFPSEIFAILKVKFGGYVEKTNKSSLDKLAVELNDIDFCYATLNKVSRSFAFVIQELPLELKDAICIFYLVLRGLDSVEDDMNYPDEKKIILLREFHKKLSIDNWTIQNVGDTKDYQILLEHFDKVIRVFKSLDVKYQSVIIEITRRMGCGMADYVGKIGSIETTSSYNLYCHYVAGLVGYGLSEIFAKSGLEDADLHLNEELSNSMGLFLQKTNIIRDYLEDLQAGRTWWPREIWQNYANDLSDFSHHPNAKQSLECLNHMVMDSLSHVPHVIQYLNRLRNCRIFKFCAIPQVMAMATLAQLYSNPKVFTSVIKIRKGLTCKLMLNCSNVSQTHSWFYLFIEKIQSKIPHENNTNVQQMETLVQQIKDLCRN